MMTTVEIRETREAIHAMCRATLRGLILAMVLGFALVLIAVEAKAASVKTFSTINDDVVRVGDIFEDAGEHAGTVIGRAPAPGSDMTLNARTLRRIASTYSIDWSPQSVAEQATIRREAHTVSADVIETALKSALIQRGVTGDYSVSVSNMTAGLVVPANVPATAEVTQLNYTPGQDHFIATIATPSAAQPVKTMTVAGVVQKTIQVPVLKSSVNKGEIIGSTDIDWVDVASRTLAPDAIVDADKLIGKTPVRFVSMGQPLRSRDVMNPQMVARGDEVTIIYNLGGMQLTAKGKAMQNGAEGDLIRTINVASSRSMNARITGDRMVVVE